MRVTIIIRFWMKQFIEIEIMKAVYGNTNH
jgi:hypothetical protein